MAATPLPDRRSECRPGSVSATRQQKVRLATTLTKAHQHSPKAKQGGQDPQRPVAGAGIWRQAACRRDFSRQHVARKLGGSWPEFLPAVQSRR